MELVEADDAPEGRRYLRLTNTDPGRPAQVFQGFPVDGRTVARLTVQAQLRAEGVRAGLASDEAPALVVKFFDEDRSRSARAFVGPWGGTFPWKEVQGTVPVPTWAREAILQVGMLGGTGQIEVDAVAIGGIAR
jgi:protein-L-isoaspartate(D-aspartate) O-methyltransferase